MTVKIFFHDKQPSRDSDLPSTWAIRLSLVAQRDEIDWMKRGELLWKQIVKLSQNENDNNKTRENF